MRYSAIYDCDLANGPGWRVSLFVSGCTLHCKGCFNQKAWDFNFGKEYTQETEDKIIELLKRPYIKGLSLLGGNPTEPENEPDLIRLCERVSRELPEKDIWMWSGHNLEDLMAKGDKLVPHCDVIIDGQFVEELKDLSLKWKGSSNQRVINVREFLENRVLEATRKLEEVLAS